MFGQLKRRWLGGEGEVPGGGGDTSSPSTSVTAVSNSSTHTQTEEQLMEKNHEEVQEDVSVMQEELDGVQKELSSLHTAVVSHLSCCLCSSLPRSLPLTTCPRHHILCDSCSSSHRASTCPTCSDSLATITSPLLAALLVTVRRPCRWAASACTFTSRRLEEVEEHEAACWHQPVTCWGCLTSCPLNYFDRHSANLACFQGRQVHYGQVERQLLLLEDQQGDTDWKPVAVKLCGKMFYLRVGRSGESWTFYLAAQLLPAACARFLTRIQVQGGHGAASRSSSGPPSSLLASPGEVVRSGACLVIPEAAMQALMVAQDKGQVFTVRAQVEAVLKVTTEG